MNSHHRFALLLLAAACPAVAAQPKADLSPADRVVRVEYLKDVMYAAMVDACAGSRYHAMPALRDAYARWNSRGAITITAGEAVMARSEPDADPAAMRAALGPRLIAQVQPGIKADPATRCTALGHTLTGGIPIAFTGQSHSNETLRHDIYLAVSTYAAAKSGCEAPDGIDSRIIEPLGSRGPGAVEDWTISGCNSVVRLRVTLTPSTRGGIGYSFRDAPTEGASPPIP